MIENDAWVAHSHQVRTELADLLSELKDAETGQRGYVITGDDSYLEPYQAALGTIQDHARRMSASSPPTIPISSGGWRAMAPLIDTKLAELKQTIDLRRTQGFDAAAKVVLTNVGKTYMDQIARDRRRGRSGGARSAEAAHPRKRAPAPT